MTRLPRPQTESAEDPILEAMARAKLRKQRGKPVHRKKPPIGIAASRILRKHAGKGGGSSLSKLQLSWPQIVGEDIARFSFPLKLTGSKVARTLTLRVIPAAAIVVQHQEETLRQRISVAAGGNITRLKLEQGALLNRKPAPQRKRRQITDSEEAELQQKTANIGSPRLKAAIVALGRAVLADERE
ncbi:MAG: DciA family protein [Pseudomonadota bacterium]